MRYWLDTEFYERPWKMDLISIGIVAEDGRELYYENSEFDWNEVPEDHWIQKNVRTHLLGGMYLQTKDQISWSIRQFVNSSGGSPEFWGYFADYDWVLFCWLQGSMIDLPSGWPQFCRDIQQLRKEMFPGMIINLPKNTGTAHNALDDARWTKQAHQYLERNMTTFKGL